MSSEAPIAARKLTADAGPDLRRLGKYHIERQLGVGGMGTVYLAVDQDLKRTVALKVLPRERAENPILVRRFKSEGQAAALLQHRNIVSVYEAGEADGYLFLALEFVDGTDVLEWIRKRGPLPVKRSIEVIRQTTEALQHAYEKNIVHRDIKPSNLMVSKDGTLKLTDMGLARSIDDTLDTTITRDGTTVGTVDYMSPEQAADSKAADIRSDIYSLGCTWYHMLTGSAPYPEGSVTNKLSAHATAPLPDPRDKNPTVPEALVAVLHRMMAKRREDRYQTPHELLADLNSDVIRHGGEPANLLSILAEEEDWFDSGSIEVGSRDVLEVRGAQPDPATPPGGRRTPAGDDVPPVVGKRRGSPRRKLGSQDAPEESADPPIPQRRKSSSPQAAGNLRPAESRRRPGSSPVEDPSQEEPQSSPPVGEGEGHVQPTPSRLKRTEPERAATQPAPSEPAAPRKPADNRPRLSRSQPVPQMPRAESTTSSPPIQESQARPHKPAPERLQRRSINETPVGGTDSSASRAPIGFDVKQILTVMMLLAVAGGAGWWGYTNWLRSGGLAPVVNPYSTGPSGTGDPQTAEGEAGAESTDEPGPDVVEAVDPTQTDQATAVSPRTAELRSILPDWLRADWIRPPSGELPVVQVKRGGGRSDEARSVDQALRQLGPRGGEVVIGSPGPWSVSSLTLNGTGRFRLRGGPGIQPVIAIESAHLDDSGNWLSINGGRIELDGLHLIVTTHDSEAEPCRLLSLTGTDAVLRNCTFTILGPGAVEILSIQGKSPDGNRVLVENSLMRGERLTAIRIGGAPCDVVIDNSLLASESAAVLGLESAADPLSQTIRVINSTVLSGNAGFALRHQGEQSSSSVQIDLARSLLVARSEQGTMFDFMGWPGTEAGRLDQPRVARVTLNARHTRFIGGSSLVRWSHPDGETQVATDESAWRQFWSQPLPSDDRIANDPHAGEMASLAELSPRMYDKVYQELARPGIGPRSLLGIDAATVPAPPPAMVQRMEAARDRPPLPQGFSDWTPRKTVELDLNRRADKFAEFLNGSECPDETHVICIGSGLRYLPPVVLTDRRLRIEFRQAEGNPLTLQPGEEADARALFTVDGGFVEIVNGTFDFPDSSRRQLPRTLIRTIGSGEFTLRNCTAVARSNSAEGPLIDISKSPDEESPRFAAVTNCFLSAAGVVFRGHFAGRSVEIDNSILISNDDLLAVSGGATPGHLLMHHCTLIAGRGIVAERSTLPEEHSGPSLHLFLKDVVYGPPVNSSEQSALLVVAHPERLGRSLLWWESGCGYAPQIPHLLRSGENGFGANFQSGWQQRWSEGHILDPLHGSRSVLLKSVLPERQKIRPVDMELDPTCQAATWSETGGPIGADVTRVGPPAASSAAGGKPATPTRPMPGRTTPGF